MLLMFNDDIGIGIKNACNYAEESEAVILAKAAQIVRRDMFDTGQIFQRYQKWPHNQSIVNARKSCSGRCKCKQNELKCSELCLSQGGYVF